MAKHSESIELSAESIKSLANALESTVVIGKPAAGNAVEPDHYRLPGGVQVIDVIKHLGFLEGNVIKYVARAGRKGDKREDLLKAKQYLDWLLEENA